MLTVTDGGVHRQRVLDGLTEDEPTFAWRADDQLVAIQSERGDRTITIRLISVPDLQKVAERRFDNGDFSILHRPLAMAFNPDGSSLWVAASSDRLRNAGTPNKITVAIELSVPALEIVDRKEIETPAPGAIITFGAYATELEQTPAGVRLTGLVQIYSSGAGVDTPTGALTDIVRSFVYSVNLTSRNEIFPVFELPVDNGAHTNRIAESIYLSPDAKRLVVQMNTSPPLRTNAPRQPVDLSKDRSFDVFDPRTRQRILRFSGGAGPFDPAIDREVSRHSGFVTPDGTERARYKHGSFTVADRDASSAER